MDDEPCYFCLGEGTGICDECMFDIEMQVLSDELEAQAFASFPDTKHSLGSKPFTIEASVRYKDPEEK